ncbi:MAG TPA: hypothetical protein EYH30_07235 [Anaerolineales bacterium]|nr:hypothetical protein [Anaerolineae bacterium]HIQ01909.1 hypothetical protein [Anaerolineales bacterium]
MREQKTRRPTVSPRGHNRPGERNALPPWERESLAPRLAEVAERLQRVMVPVEPSTAFVRSLGQELIEASRRRQEATRRLRRGLIIGAAALGSAASVAGVVALVLLRRRAHAGPQPAPG